MGGPSPPPNPSPHPPLSSCTNDSLSNSVHSQISDIFQCDGNVSTEYIDNDDSGLISVQITYDRPDKPSYSGKPIKKGMNNLVTIKRSNKLLEASSLPVVVNLNPRSLYNKQEEFRTMIEQTEAGVCCVSETWDRSHVSGGSLISDLIQIDGYRWIKNVLQRKGRVENRLFWPMKRIII